MVYSPRWAVVAGLQDLENLPIGLMIIISSLYAISAPVVMVTDDMCYQQG